MGIETDVVGGGKISKNPLSSRISAGSDIRKIVSVVDKFVHIHPESKRDFASHMRNINITGLNAEELAKKYSKEAYSFLAKWHELNGRVLSGTCPSCNVNVPLFIYVGENFCGSDSNNYSCPGCYSTHTEGEIRKYNRENQNAAG